MTVDPKVCPGCGLQLAGRTHYREIEHCWVLKRTQGGADQVKAAKYTMRRLCAQCLLDVVGPSEGTPMPKASYCNDCGAGQPPLYAEVVHCWVQARSPGAHAPTRIRYSGRVLCRRCAFGAEQGEQLVLFDG